MQKAPTYYTYLVIINSFGSPLNEPFWFAFHLYVDPEIFVGLDKSSTLPDQSLPEVTVIVAKSTISIMTSPVADKRHELLIISLNEEL